jgi:hypothetical protein
MLKNSAAAVPNSAGPCSPLAQNVLCGPGTPAASADHRAPRTRCLSPPLLILRTSGRQKLSRTGVEELTNASPRKHYGTDWHEPRSEGRVQSDWDFLKSVLSDTAHLIPGSDERLGQQTTREGEKLIRSCWSGLAPKKSAAIGEGAPLMAAVVSALRHRTGHPGMARALGLHASPQKPAR